ncbi:hypothetical protein P3X46_032129 [Hevea brasiliensis]|uniref:Uncharacterized protein n=1 Tax=Hevea brasiliensis TaxID=3981 RepID=A0ABQ9KF93_HEVBR|nr:hypothetical protein P3X46_032129 [Hevea brasiliensis]
MHQLRGAETASSNFYASSNPTTTAWSTSIPSCCQSATGISTKSSADATTATPGSPSANAPFAYATSKYAAATTTITFTPPPSSSSSSSSTNASSWCAWILACAFIDAHITPIANARSNGDARYDESDGPSNATRPFYGHESDALWILNHKCCPFSWGLS